MSAAETYRRMGPVWERARDVIAGEDAVKAAGERYLPRLEQQTDEEYAAYKTRASFFGAAARTLGSFLDLVFRKAPVVNVPAELKGFVADCDGLGTPWARYARTVLSEVLTVGRAGSLVERSEAGRVRVRPYRAEEIVDWEVGWGGELKKVQFGEWVEGVHSIEECRMGSAECGAGRLSFVFHGPTHGSAEPEPLPLADLITANLDHYRLDADYKNALHFVALPTVWVSGFDKEKNLRVGSARAWQSDTTGATAGFLEFRGEGIQYLERALERVERRVALLGARMLEKPAADGSASVAVRGESESGYLCGLAEVARSVNESLTKVLEVAYWSVTGSDAQPGQIVFALNSAFEPAAISAPEITAVVEAWKAGAISRDTMLEYFKRRELLPEGRTAGEERAIVNRG